MLLSAVDLLQLRPWQNNTAQAWIYMHTSLILDTSAQVQTGLLWLGRGNNPSSSPSYHVQTMFTNSPVGVWSWASSSTSADAAALAAWTVPSPWSLSSLFFRFTTVKKFSSCQGKPKLHTPGRWKDLTAIHTRPTSTRQWCSHEVAVLRPSRYGP